MSTRCSGRLVLVCLAATMMCGCSEGSESSSVALSGIVTEYDPQSPDAGPPIEGVEICQFASNNCAVSDEDGAYVLRLLQSRDVELSHVKDGFGPVLIARFSGTEDLVGDVVLATDAALATLSEEVGTPYPPVNTGALTATAFRGPTADGDRLAGASYSLLGSSGRSFYLNDSGAADTSLTATQTPGAGGFVELTPVRVTLQLSGAAVNCTSEESWAAAASNAFRLPVRAGFWTQIAVNCE